MTGSRVCWSPCRNPPPTGKDELAGVALSEGSGTPTLIPAMSRVFTPYFTIKIARTCAWSSYKVSIYNGGSCVFTFILACTHCLYHASLHYKGIHKAVEKNLKELQPIFWLCRASKTTSQIRDHFNTAKASDLNWTLLLPYFPVKTLAPDKFNAQQSQIFFETPLALYYGSK